MGFVFVRNCYIQNITDSFFYSLTLFLKPSSQLTSSTRDSLPDGTHTVLYKMGGSTP